MGTIYCDTGGADTNSGSRDANSPALSGSAATVAASVVTLDGSPDLSGVSTSGDTQDTIYLNDATNANQKRFWITAVDNGAKTVTVSVAPTGVVSSSWTIGGRVLTPQQAFNAHMRAGDTCVINNSPASHSGSTMITARSAGDKTTGPIKLKGKAGVMPVLTVTDTNVVVSCAQALNFFLDFAMVQQGASGNVMSLTGTGNVARVKISDGGGIGISYSSGGSGILVDCEISGTAGDGIDISGGGNNTYIDGCYVHDVAGIGIDYGAANFAIAFCVIDTCADRGIRCNATSTSAANLSILRNNTVYNCGNSGFEQGDSDNRSFIRGNIFMDNGNAAGEFNVEWTAGSAELAGGWHSHNLFSKSSNNVSGLTIGADQAGTEPTTDPAFVDAANGNFALTWSSSAKAAAYPGIMPGALSTGYLDIGAVQRQEQDTIINARPTAHLRR